MDDVRAVPTTPTDEAATRSGRLVVALVLGVLVVVLAYFVLGMPGMDHGGSSDAGHDTVDGVHSP